MAIAFKSSGAGVGTETSGAALDVPCPATVDANDILIAHILHTGTTTGPSTPSGWTLLYGPANVGTTATARHWVFGKLAAGNEDGTNIGFGTDGGTNGRAGRIYSFSGYVSGTLADVVPSASFSDIAHATDPQGPSVTTTVAGALAIACMCQDDNNTPPAITGMTGGTWVENAEYVNATWGPQGINMSINSCIPTADPGTVSGGAQVATNDESGTIGFEIRPNPLSGISLRQSKAANNYSGSFTSGSATFDSATVSGNLLIAVCVPDKNVGSFSSPPSGWTLLQDEWYGNMTSGVGGGIYWKVASGSETTVSFSWTTTAVGWAVWIGEYEGFTDTPSLETHNLASLDPSTGTSVGPATVAIAGAAELIAIYCVESGNSDNSLPPTIQFDGVTQTEEGFSFLNSGCPAITIARKAKTSGGSYGVSKSGGTSADEQFIVLTAWTSGGAVGHPAMRRFGLFNRPVEIGREGILIS